MKAEIPLEELTKEQLINHIARLQHMLDDRRTDIEIRDENTKLKISLFKEEKLLDTICCYLNNIGLSPKTDQEIPSKVLKAIQRMKAAEAKLAEMPKGGIW